jgi:hypothetical protein
MMRSPLPVFFRMNVWTNFWPWGISPMSKTAESITAVGDEQEAARIKGDASIAVMTRRISILDTIWPPSRDIILSQ